MKSWILSVGATIILTSLICLILPEGKMGKYIKSIFSILVLLTIFSPIINIKNINVDIDTSLIYGGNIELQTEYLSYVYEKKIDEYKINCLKIIENFGIDNVSVDISYSIKDDKIFIENLYINLKDAVINSDKNHIVIIEEIKNEIKKYLMVDNLNMVINE